MSALQKLLDEHKEQKAEDEKAAANELAKQLEAEAAYLERAQAALCAALPEGLFKEIVVGGDFFEGDEYELECWRLTTSTPVVLTYSECYSDGPRMKLCGERGELGLPASRAAVAEFFADAIEYECKQAEKRETREAEQVRLLALQEEVWPADVAFTAYRVTYSECSMYPDGERFIEKSHLYTLNLRPDDDGFWLAWKLGKAVVIKVTSDFIVERISLCGKDAIARLHFSTSWQVGDDEVLRPIDAVLVISDRSDYPALPEDLFSELPF